MAEHETITEIRRLRAIRETITATTNEAILDALRAGQPTGLIATALDVSETHVRTIRRKGGLSPDPRYAHLRPPVPAKKETTP